MVTNKTEFMIIYDYLISSVVILVNYSQYYVSILLDNRNQLTHWNDYICSMKVIPMLRGSYTYLILQKYS